VVQKLLPQVSFVTTMLDTLIDKSLIKKAFLFDVISKIYIATDSSPVDMKEYEICSELIDVLIDVTCIYGNEQVSGNSKFDNKSSSIIRLQVANSENSKLENKVMYLREVDRCLALVCLIKADDFHKQHLIDYNIDNFKTGLK
jgi:Ras-related GTP-binding protein C/D